MTPTQMPEFQTPLPSSEYDIEAAKLRIDELESTIAAQKKIITTQKDEYSHLLEIAKKIEAERDTIMNTFKTLMKELCVLKS